MYACKALLNNDDGINVQAEIIKLPTFLGLLKLGNYSHKLLNKTMFCLFVF